MEGRRDQVAEVVDRAEALSAALDVGAAWLDPVVVERTRNAVDRAITRFELGGDHTVVALVGATGSGKSSLFNALAAMEIAPVGARRPLTSMPMACVWGEGGSQQLLDWLEVPESRRMTRESVLDADYQAPLNGLVLLDLPDHDSTEVIHRVEVDRLVTMVDLLIWVVDPQKYADDALHSGYLQRMVGHAGVMVVVLNQIDRLSPDEAQTCERDLRRLLDGDGLEAVRMLPISATRGDGVDDLRTLLAAVVQDRSAIAERVGADLRATTEAVLTGLAPAEPGNGEPPGEDRLVEELAAAAGLPIVIDALAVEYRRRGWKRAGWPMLHWLRWLVPARRSRDSNLNQQDLRVLASSQPQISASSQRSSVDLALESAIAASAEGLPSRWADAVRDNVFRPGEAPAAPGDDLVAALDERIKAIDLRLDPPVWWWLAAALQYLMSLAVVAAVVWLALIGVLRIGGGSAISTPPKAIGIPLPLLLIIVGLAGAAVLLALTAWALAVGARRRRLGAQLRLHLAVEAVARERVIVPIRVVLAQHRATRLALAGSDVVRPEPQHRAVVAEAASDPTSPAGTASEADGASGQTSAAAGDRPGDGSAAGPVPSDPDSGPDLGSTPASGSHRLPV